jgi:hypothetical protein
MFKMRKFVVFVLFLLTACGPTPTLTPPSNPAPTDKSIPTAAPQIIPTAIVHPTLAGAPDAAGFWFQVLSPLDEAVVDAPEVEVTGSAPAGSVISVNDEILIVGADLQFKTTISLEEGPNLIEIVASDEIGNELTVLLTVTYEP